MNIIKKIAYIILSRLKTKNGESLLTRIKIIGLKRTCQYWFFQRVLRMNSNVNWPVHPSSFFGSPEKIIKKSFLPYFASPGIYIQASNGIIVGDNLRVGPRVILISANHDLDDYTRHIKTDPIIIGDNCWLGANVVILPRVKLKNHVVVGAGAVVTKSFEENNIFIAGVPAKIGKKLGEYKGRSDWWSFE